MPHVDSLHVLGGWGMAAHEMENYFDVPITGPSENEGGPE